MLRTSEQVDCIILADCLTSYSQEDIQLLMDNFGLYEYDHYIEFDAKAGKEILKRYNTFRVIITDDVYAVLANNYRLPEDAWPAKHFNKQYRDNIVGLDEYLTLEEIRQLSFFEYGEEQIHSIYNQDKSEETHVYCSAKDLALVSKKLREYLLTNDEQWKLDKKYAAELQQLELLSSIANKYDSEFLLILWGLP